MDLKNIYFSKQANYPTQDSTSTSKHFILATKMDQPIRSIKILK